MGDHDGLESVITIGWNTHPVHPEPAQTGRPGDGWIRVFDLDQQAPIWVDSETAPRRAA